MADIKALASRAFKDIAFIDFRALGLFRIGLGIVLFFDLLSKSFDVTAFYTDRGILSREMVTQDLGWWTFSFHLANGSAFFQMILFFLGFVLAIALLAGYQTRITTVLMWIFVVSMQERNGLILHSGDALIRLTLFWSMFLPLGARYSLDSLLEPSLKSRYRERGIASLASLSLLLQVLFVYFFTALLKDHPDWNKTYHAVYYTLNLGQFATAIGNLLRDYLWLTKILTFITYHLELFGPVFLVIPFIQRYVRTVVPLMFIGLHFSLFLTMTLGLFPWICIVAWIAFLPSPILDLIEKHYIRAIKLPKPALKTWKTQIEPHLPAKITWKRPRAARLLATAFVLISLICALGWNVGTIPRFKFERPQLLRAITLFLHLDQYWSMFAPNPMRADGWFVVDGTLRDGTTFDTWNKMDPPWELPADFFPLYRSTQWRKYLTNVWIGNDNSRKNQLAFGKYICREWNDLSGKRPVGKTLTHYDFYMIRKNTPPPGEVPVFKRVHLWTHDCFGTVEPAPKSPRRITD